MEPSMENEHVVWEQYLVEQILLELDFVTMSKEVLDGWIWQGVGSLVFSIKNAYDLTLVIKNSQLAMLFFNSIWTLHILSKVKALFWKISINRLAPRENLKKRNILLSTIDCSCVLCGDVVESSDHLFFKCRFVYAIWNNCYKWIGVYVILLFQIDDHIWQHCGFLVGKKPKLAWWNV